ncbi:MAG TPA: class I SAM-dependent methyltransferase [Micavibrio sp.]|jgi:SAM-dependent methyltransferase
MEQSAYEIMAETQAEHWWYVGRRRILQSMIKNLHLPQDADIMEVGCGTGANLLMLGKFGRTVGIEPHDYAREKAIALSGCVIKSGFLPDDIPFHGPFDLIGAFDVIEHIDKDYESVRALHALTADGGFALFTVPAWPFLWSHHDVIHHHKRRYTRSEFSTLLQEAGYKVDYISYYNFLLFPVVALVRFLKKTLKIDRNPDDALPRYPFINAILRAIFSSERYILSQRIALPFGVSIIAVCRKQI